MAGVYVLELKNGMRYVGSSHNTSKRIRQHFNGEGSALSQEFGARKKHPCMTTCMSDLILWEQKETLAQMMIHGFDKVRGSMWIKKDPLSPEDREMIQKLVTAGDNRCIKCGNRGHMVSSCNARAKAEWLEKLWSPSPPRFSTSIQKPKYMHKQRQLLNEDTKKVSNHQWRARQNTTKQSCCFRCGRGGHWADECYAQTSIKGKWLDSDDSDSDDGIYLDSDDY